MLRVLLESVVATGTFLGLYGAADAVRFASAFFFVVVVSFFLPLSRRFFFLLSLSVSFLSSVR